MTSRRSRSKRTGSVSDRLDVIRSFVRAAAEGVGRAVEKLRPLGALGANLRDFRRQRAVLRDDLLSTAVAHGQRIRSASVATRDGAIFTDVTSFDGDSLQVVLVPLGARFAPHGAKEIFFRVEPAECIGHPIVPAVTSAIAGAIAHSLWRLGVPADRAEFSGAIVERDGDDRVRIDLRSVPAVRRASHRSALRILLDAIEVTGVRAELGTLEIDFSLPDIPF